MNAKEGGPVAGERRRLEELLEKLNGLDSRSATLDDEELDAAFDALYEYAKSEGDIPGDGLVIDCLSALSLFLPQDAPRIGDDFPYEPVRTCTEPTKYQELSVVLLRDGREGTIVDAFGNGSDGESEYLVEIYTPSGEGRWDVIDVRESEIEAELHEGRISTD